MDPATVAVNSQPQLRRKSSFKCPLKTKAVPHGRTTAQTKKGDAKSPVLDKGMQAELETVLAGLKLRKTPLIGGATLDGNGKEGSGLVANPRKFNHQKSSPDPLASRTHVLPTHRSTSDEPLHSSQSSSPKPSIVKTTKPVVAKKPKNAASEAVPITNDQSNLNKVQTAPGRLAASPLSLQVVVSETSGDKSKPVWSKPKVPEKPHVTLPVLNSSDGTKPLGIKKSPTLQVPSGRTPSSGSEGTGSPSDSMGKTKLSALKAMFENSSSQNPEKSPDVLSPRSHGLASGSHTPTGRNSPLNKSPNTSPNVRVKFFMGQGRTDDPEEVPQFERQTSKQSNSVAYDDVLVDRCSVSSAYDDVLVNRCSVSSMYDDVLVQFGIETQGETGSVNQSVKSQDGTDKDSGKGSSLSTDENSQRQSIEDTVPGEDSCGWVDEPAEPSPHEAVMRQRSHNSIQGHRYSEPRKPRRVTTPKKRFWSNPERTIVVSSSLCYDYDDVEIPQGDCNPEEWETDSDVSEADANMDTVDGLCDRPRPRRKVPLPIPTTEDTEENTQQKGSDPGMTSLDPPPLLPRSASGSPKHPTRSVPTPPMGTPPMGASPRNSPMSSPSRRRKISLEMNIPAPRHPIGVSLSRDSGGYSGSSNSSLSDVSEVPPPVPPSRQRSSTEKKTQREAPALPTRRKTSPAHEVAPAPPLPPRTTGKVATLNGEPPPAPPRSRALSKVNKKELTPNTVVPLSPEAKNAAKKKTEGPKLPPRRRTFENLVPPSFSGSEGHRSKSSTNPAEGGNRKNSGGTSMLGEVPPPPATRNAGSGPSGDDYIGPNPPLPDAPLPEGMLRNSGYLDMDTSRLSGRSSQRSSVSSDNYIDPHRELATHPQRDGRRPPEPFGNLWATSTLERASSSDSDTKDDYLEILESDFPEGASSTLMSRSTSKRFIDEPLYQIYHYVAVARDVLGQQRDEESDDDSEMYGTCSADDEAENETENVTDIYSTWEQLAKSKPSPAEITSTLQNVIKTTTGVRTLWCEIPEVRDKGTLASMTMEERKFQEALFEIITSEASYLKSLDLLISHFMHAETFTPDIVSKSDKHVLFSNVISVRNISEQFMSELEALWQANCVLSPSMTSLITKFASGPFQVYVTYCSNQVYQERRLKHLKYTQPMFRDALYNLERSSMCHSLPMQSFLALPMQRITRLPLLVDAICHRMSPTHPHYNTVVTALQSLQKLVRQCNEGARQMENLEKIAEIDKCLDFKNVKRMPLVSVGRHLVKKGQLTHIFKLVGGIIIKKKKEHLYLFLLNDILLITKRKSEDQYQVIDYASRINCHAESLEDDEVSRALPHGVPTGCRNVFSMALLENHEKKHTDFYFACETPSERMRWVEAVTPAQQINDDERIYEAWASPQVQAIYRYVATEPDELSLEESDIVNISRKMADGWYEGERIRDGERGWFPANHTVEIQSERVRARNLLQRYRLLTMNAHGIQQNVSSV